jgi:hypothetical protein
MDVTIKNALIRMCQERGVKNIETLVNRLLSEYLKGHFYGKKDIAAMVKVEKPYRVHREEIADMYDEHTQEFLGVVVVGESESKSIWVPSPTLYKHLCENDTVVVLKTPRKKGIRVKQGEQVYAWLPEEDDVN